MRLSFVLSLITFFCFFKIQAQVQEPLPTEEEWQNYFHHKKASLQTKLYLLAVAGKIKAYKNDSLTSFFEPSLFLKRGSTEIGHEIDSNYFIDEKTKSIIHKNNEAITKRREQRFKLKKETITVQPFDYNWGLKEFWFTKRIKTSPFDTFENSYMDAMALTFTPTYMGYAGRIQPLCWFSIIDLKHVLLKDEFEWIQLMFYYTKNDNTLVWRRFDQHNDDIYQEINNTQSAYVIYACDSMMFVKISNTIYHSSFYINRFLRDDTTNKSNMPIIFDHQKNEQITYSQFQKNYYDELLIILPLDPKKPNLNREAIYESHWELNLPREIEFDTINFKLKSFIFEFRKFQPKDQLFKFSIDADIIRKTETRKTLFWFFEDYYKWSH